jgi:hypothetical protein
MPWTQPQLDHNLLSHLLLSEPHSLSTGTITTIIITITEGKMPDSTFCLHLVTTFSLSPQRFLQWIQQMDSTSDQFVMLIVCHQWFQVSIVD